MTEKPVPKRGKFLLIFGSLWFFFGLIFSFVGYLSYQKEARFKKEGTTVPAVIISKSMESHKDKDNQTTRTYYLTYQFSTKSGQKLESKSSLSQERWESYKENDPVDIIYIESDASENRIAGTDDNIAMWLFSAFGLICSVGGALVIWFDIKARMEAKRLMLEGALTEAIVTMVGPGNLTINDEVQWRIHFSFKDMYGKPVDGQTGHLSPEAAQQWKQGDKGRVRYDKQNPKKYIWVGA